MGNHVPNYRLVEPGSEGGINGGILKAEREGAWPGSMLFYTDVDDLPAYREKIVAAGGKIHVQEREVLGMGAFSLDATFKAGRLHLDGSLDTLRHLPLPLT